MPRHIASRTLARALATIVLLTLAVACGSGGGSNGSQATPPVPTPHAPATPSPEMPPSATPSDGPTLAAGTLDDGFGDGGVVRGVVSAGFASLRDVALQPDGRIVALGDVRDAARPQLHAFALVRHDASGGIDETFGAGGVAEHVSCANGDPACAALGARQVVALADGRLVVLASDVGGALHSRIFALGADGALDAGVGDAGVLVLPALLERIALAPDGAVVGAGRGRDAFALLRLGPDLVPDEGFGPLGLRLVDLGDAQLETFRHLAVQRDGRVVAGGVLQALDVPAAALARFTSDGAPDPAFGDGGWLLAAPRADLFRGVAADAGPLAVTDDGRILVEMPRATGGASRGVVRLLPDGSPDPAWAEPTTAALELLLRAGGGLLTVGFRRVIDFGFVLDLDGELRGFVADGMADVAFGSGGATPLPGLDGVPALPAGAAVQDDGKLVVGGNRIDGAGWLLARFLP